MQIEYGQIEYNSKKSYDDFGFVINDIKIGLPEQNIIKESVPFQNGFYDFSEINGETTYSERKIKIALLQQDIRDYRRDRLNIIYTNVVNWLMGAGTNKLKLTWLKGLFTARVNSISDIDLLEKRGIVEVEFLCQPFRQWENYESDFIWDTFNFETDVIQGVYEVNGELEITLVNLSIHKVKPLIIASSTMDIEIISGGLGIEYSVNKGITENLIQLDRGENKIKITGTGTIEFKWRREVI